MKWLAFLLLFLPSLAFSQPAGLIGSPGATLGCGVAIGSIDAILGGPGPGSCGVASPSSVISAAGLTVEFWHSCTRAYSLAYAKSGGAACRLYRTSDAQQKDIGFLPNGLINLNVATTFCASTTCYVAVAYDHTGNNYYASQGTAALMPQFLFNCVRGLPCVKFVSANSTNLLGGFTASTFPNPVGYFEVEQHTVSNTNFQLSYGVAGGAGFLVNNTNSVGYAGQNLTFGTASDFVFHALGGFSNSTTDNLYVDGVFASSTAGTAPAQALYPEIGSQSGSGSYWDGLFVEGGAVQGTVTAGNFLSMCNNQLSAGLILGPC